MVVLSRMFIAIVLLFASTLAFANTPININTADEQMLITLSGVGPAKAKAIVAYRDEYGAFKSVEELANVKGIGEKTVERNRENMIVEEQKTK